VLGFLQILGDQSFLPTSQGKALLTNKPDVLKTLFSYTLEKSSLLLYIKLTKNLAGICDYIHMLLCVCVSIWWGGALCTKKVCEAPSRHNSNVKAIGWTSNWQHWLVTPQSDK
jgi:hypothetical protein